MPQQTTATATRSPKRADKASPKVIEEMVQTSFRLPLSRWRKLQNLCTDQRASVQSVIVIALEAEFARHGINF